MSLKLPLYFERDYTFFKMIPTDIFSVFCFSLSWKSSSWEKEEFESDFIFLRLPLPRKHKSPQRETGGIQIVLNILLLLINFDFWFLGHFSIHFSKLCIISCSWLLSFLLLIICHFCFSSCILSMECTCFVSIAKLPTTILILI